jgi:preprotein translocase subunit YajC
MSQTTFQALTPLILPIGLVFLMYIMFYLPQKKREKKTKQMLDSLKVGNQVITIGGMVGRILNIKDDEVVIESSIEKTQVKIMKWAVREVQEKAS